VPEGLSSRYMMKVGIGLCVLSAWSESHRHNNLSEVASTRRYDCTEVRSPNRQQVWLRHTPQVHWLSASVPVNAKESKKIVK